MTELGWIVAWYHRALEAGVVDTGKIIEFTWLQFTYAFKRQNTGGLRHRFQDQNARKNRFTREMPLEKRFINRNVLHCTQVFVLFKFQHAVYQQKRIAVRQQLLNLFNFQSMSFSSQNTLPVLKI